MFLRLSFLLLAATRSVDAFSPMAPPTRRFSVRPTAIMSDFGTAMPEAPASPYEELGIQEEQLALGIDPKDVLTYVGTRESLIERTMNDIESFDRTKAEAEVDRFLMDKEAVGMMIEFYKRKEADPDFKVQDPEEQKEGLFSFRTLVIFYLGYVAYTTVPVVFRNWVAKQEAAGAWSGTNIPFLDDWIANTPVITGAAVQTATDAAAQIVTESAAQSVTENVAQTVTENVAQTMTDVLQTAQTVTDALQ